MYRGNFYHANYGVDVSRSYYCNQHVMEEEYMYQGDFGHHDQSLEHLQNPLYPTEHYDFSTLRFPPGVYGPPGSLAHGDVDAFVSSKMPPLHHQRKRKSLSVDFDSAEEEDPSSTGMLTPDLMSPEGMLDPTDPRKHHRQNHSEIEKRRRDKMNSYITELSAMIPMCNAMNRKLDKLTVLRMAVQHMKFVRCSNNTFSEVSHKTSYISDDELKHLILGVAEGFLFVVGCDRGKILYVSQSVQSVLNCSQTEVIGESLFDILHPRDISKVKEQLSASDVTPRERLIDAKTMMPVKTEMPQTSSNMCSGARRSFFCRMKCGSNLSEAADDKVKVKKDLESYILNQQKKKSENHKNFVVVHCTGYMKSWSEAKVGLDEENDAENYNSNLSCLVAIGRIQQQYIPNSEHDHDVNVPSMEFTSRQSIDGKFTNVDERATIILGYLPQELLGTSLYEYYHPDDIISMADFHRKVLESKVKIETGVYRFRVKDGKYIRFKSKCFSFRNPWTKEVECIVSTNVVVQIQEVSSSGQSTDAGDESAVVDSEEPLPSLCAATRTGVARIGQQIADDALDSSKNASMSADSSVVKIDGAPQSPRHSGHPVLLPGAMSSSAAPHLGASMIRPLDAMNLNGITVRPQEQPACLLESVIHEQVFDDMQYPGSEVNDEAALAFIMSLLEADGGLGGPVDFNDLPWPL